MVRAGPDPETDGVVWRRIDLKRKIEFGVTMHELLAKIQEAFKKTSYRPETARSKPLDLVSVPNIAYLELHFRRRLPGTEAAA